MNLINMTHNALIPPFHHWNVCRFVAGTKQLPDVEDEEVERAAQGLYHLDRNNSQFVWDVLGGFVFGTSDEALVKRLQLLTKFKVIHLVSEAEVLDVLDYLRIYFNRLVEFHNVVGDLQKLNRDNFWEMIKLYNSFHIQLELGTSSGDFGRFVIVLSQVDNGSYEMTTTYRRTH